MDFFDALVATTTTADGDGLEYLRRVSSYHCGSASRYFFEDSTKARDLIEFMIENRDAELRKLAFDEVDIRCSTAKERFAWLWRIVPTELDPALREHYLDRYTDVSEDAEPRNLARWDARDGDLDVPTNPRIAPLNAEEMALEIRTEAGPYLSPYGISLLVEWYGQEPDSSVRDEIDTYLRRDFRPILPLQDDPVSQHLDELVSLVDSMQTYAWVAPATFAAELQTELAAAQAALSSGDSTGAANQIAHFQATMQAAYEYPVTGVHEATREGHRFLWWTAEYLRNRLPDVADVPVLSLLPAAATFVSDALNPQFVGTTFRVYGREHDIGGQTTGSGDDRHGIVTSTAQATQDILDALEPDQTSRVRGSGASPDVVVDTPVLDIAALVDQFLAHPNLVLLDSLLDSDIGSAEAPVVAYAGTYDLELRSDMDGYGVLIVDGLVQFRNRSKWHGLLVVRPRVTEKARLALVNQSRVIGAAAVLAPSDVARFLVRDSARLLWSLEALEMVQSLLDVP